MSGSGEHNSTPAESGRLWRELYVLNFGRNLGGRDKRLRGAVPFSSGRSLVSQGFLSVYFEVHNFVPMWTASEYHATLRLCRDVRGELS